MSANGIAHLASREARQKAKLDLAAAKRQADVANRDNPVNADTRYTYDITELPTQFSGNTIVDNPNSGGLVVGRPWVSAPPFTLTEHIETNGSTIIETNVGPLTLAAKATSYQVQPPVDGYIKVNGTTIKTTNLAAGSRGHTLAVISPAGATVGSITTYDTYNGTTEQNAFAAALNAVASGNYIVVVSWDACAVNAAIRSALTTGYGATLSTIWAATRYSHIFIGVKA